MKVLGSVLIFLLVCCPSSMDCPAEAESGLAVPAYPAAGRFAVNGVPLNYSPSASSPATTRRDVRAAEATTGVPAGPAVKSPWALLLTAGLVGLVGFGRGISRKSRPRQFAMKEH
jgi:hypothetical protein